MVNGKARYTAALAFLAVTLLTATGSSIAAQGAVPQILPLDEEDDDILICDDLDDDGILDLLDNCFGLFNPLQTDTNANGIGDECEAPLPN
ncbi:MAG: hypothetical protein VYB82_02610 [Pseudomonadota bacterium]|nr:hypothetical protein [Pseudomonadota bacterium]